MQRILRSGSALAVLLVCAPAIVPGCAPPDGEVVFGVTTEIPAGLVLTRVETRLTVDGGIVSSLAYDGADLDFPFEVATGELPEGSRVELQLDAFQGAELIVARTAATTIVSDRKLLLEVALEDECEDVACADSETCISGTCVEPFEDPSKLRDYYEKWAGGETGDRCEPGGEPVVLIGQGQSDYHEVESGQVLEVEEGPQGGYHVWVAARIKNLRQSGSVTEVSGTFPALSYSPSPLQVVFTFDPDEGDYCKLYGLRFRLDDNAHPIETLLGQTLQLKLKVSDQDEDVGTAEATVVLSDEVL